MLHLERESIFVAPEKACISKCKIFPYLQPGPSGQGCQTSPNKVANIYAIASCCVISGGGTAGPKAPVNQHNPHIAAISPKACPVVVLPGLDELGTPLPSFAGYRVWLGPVLEAMCEDLQRYVVSEARRCVYGGLQTFVVKVGH